MTLLAALIPPDPTQPPPPGVWVDPYALPDVNDPLIMGMRPDGQRYATLRVGPGREFDTVSGALGRAALLHSALTGAGITVDRNKRIDVIIDPGTYPETASAGALAVGQHMALYAADGQPRSVTIYAGADPCSGWSYHEGIVYDPRGFTTGAKYGVHHAGKGTTIFSGCHLYYSDSPIGSGWPMGMDGYGYGYTLMYNCHFTGAAAGSRTNNHAAGPTYTDPETFVYVGCEFANGGLEYNPLSSPGAHALWGIDNTAEWVGVGEGSGSTFYSSGNVQTDQSHWPTYRKTPDAVRRDWPIPYGGLSDYWRTTLGLPAYTGPDLHT